MRWFFLFLFCHTVASASTVLILGDQLSSQTQLKPGSSWTALLEKKLQTIEPSTAVIHVTSSHMTTQGGLQVLPSYLKRYQPDLILIALGYENAQRGIAMHTTRSQLTTLVQQAQAVGTVLLLGSQLPTRHPQAATLNPALTCLYQQVSQSTAVATLPNLLVNLTDHDFRSPALTPTQSAQIKLFRTVWRWLNQSFPDYKKILQATKKQVY